MPRSTAAGDGPHPVDRHVGRRVSEKRTSLGYSQSDLARALGLTFQQVQKYEKGANRVSSSKLWDIADFFGVDVQYFFEGLAKGRSDSAGTAIEEGLPQTRATLEISRLAPRLSGSQQKLVLDLVRVLADDDDASKAA